MAVSKRKAEPPSITNCYDPEMRMIIAWRIRDERMRLYPKMGGAKKCSEAFGVSQQQWSLYENGGRTPNDAKLEQLAKMFNVTLAHMKTKPDNWPEIRKRMLRMKKRRELIKLDKLDEILESDDEAESSANAGADEGAVAETENGGQTDAAAESASVSESDAFSQPLAITVGSLIDQIIAVDKMHDKGQIPTEVFTFAMESIRDDLLKLAARHRIGQER